MYVCMCMQRLMITLRLVWICNTAGRYVANLLNIYVNVLLIACACVCVLACAYIYGWNVCVPQHITWWFIHDTSAVLTVLLILLMLLMLHALWMLLLRMPLLLRLPRLLLMLLQWFNIPLKWFHCCNLIADVFGVGKKKIYIQKKVYWNFQFFPLWHLHLFHFSSLDSFKN